MIKEQYYVQYKNQLVERFHDDIFYCNMYNSDIWMPLFWSVFLFNTLILLVSWYVMTFFIFCYNVHNKPYGNAMKLWLHTKRVFGTVRRKIWFNPPCLWKSLYHIWAIAVFPVFQLLTDFVCLLTYGFCFSLWKIARCSVILLLPLHYIILYGACI